MENLLEVRGLCKQYKGFFLDHVDLTVPPGCIVGLIGENGAGKTTILKAVTHAIFPDSGEIRLPGGGPADEKARAQTAAVFENSFFCEQLKIGRIERIMAGTGGTWDREKFFENCRRWRLPEDKVIKTFSRGMRTKLALAAALARRPRLLILDEATSGLDPVARGELMENFLDFIQDEGCSVLISSHITDDLEQVADEIAYLRRGKLLFQRNKDDLLENTAVLRCGERELESLPPGLLMAKARQTMGYAALVKEPERVRYLLPDAVIDRLTLSEMMRIYAEEE